MVDVLEPQHAGDVGTLLPAARGQDRLDACRRRRPVLVGRLEDARYRSTGGQGRPPVGGGSRHRDAGALVGDRHRDHRVAPVAGAQPQSGGPQPRVVLSGDQQTGRAAAEGLHRNVRVSHDHDLRPVPIGIRGGQGRQEPSGGGRTVLVVIDDDEVGDGAGHGDAVGAPRP